MRERARARARARENERTRERENERKNEGKNEGKRESKSKSESYIRAIRIDMMDTTVFAQARGEMGRPSLRPSAD